MEQSDSIFTLTLFRRSFLLRAQAIWAAEDEKDKSDTKQLVRSARLCPFATPRAPTSRVAARADVSCGCARRSLNTTRR